MGDIPTLELLKSEYNKGKSIQDIASNLGHSVHKIAYWMKKYDISRRGHSEAAYIQQNPNGDPFKIKKINSNDDALLFGLGIGIYWGEGNKSDRHSVRITNTDPRMIVVFRQFPRDICNIKESKLSYSIVAFNDSNIEAVSEYWSKELGIEPTKFGKIVQIPPQGKGSYKNKSRFGVCSISFGNIKLKEWIMNQLFRPGGSVVEQTHGKG
mgnify:CR=1 FL=1